MQPLFHDIVIYTVPILFGLTVHEFAHGLAADYFGDYTPRKMGRLTLNPLAHLDFFGTLVFFITRAFGWAKPISINPDNLASPRYDLMRIALAGPQKVHLGGGCVFCSNIVISGCQPVRYPVLPSSPVCCRPRAQHRVEAEYRFDQFDRPDE